MLLLTPLFTFPAIDPIALEIGPLAIRWYALAYVAGILLGMWYIARLNKIYEIFSKQALDDLITYAVLGIILGGRFGYVFFYNPSYYMANPIDIFKVWQGGMAFHGGVIGLAIALYLMSRKYKLTYFSTLDMITAAAPIGLCLGRIANFINSELFGRVTDHPIGIIFPHGGPLPRHPSQLYESFLEGLVLFLILWLVVRYTSAMKKPGIITGLFLIGYGIARSIVEFFREPDAHLGFILGPLTMGQLLSLPMIMLGVGFIIYAMKKARHVTN